MNPLSPRLSQLVANDFTDDVPPFSVVVVKSVVETAETELTPAESITHVTRFDGALKGNLMVTGFAPISANGGLGTAFFDSFQYVSIDPDGGDPVAGEEWGPKPGQWTLFKGYQGFIAQGHSNNRGQPKRSTFYRVTSGSRWFYGKLATPMTAGSLESPTTTTVNVWLKNWATAGSVKPLIVASDAALLGVTVVNRSAMSGSIGAMVKIEYSSSYQEWSILWADC